MRHVLVGTVLVAGALAGARVAAAQPASPNVPRAPGKFEQQAFVVQNTPIKNVVIDNRLGSVTIRGHDKPSAIISAYKRAPTGAVLARLRVKLIALPNGQVSITSVLAPSANSMPIRRGSISIDLEITVPRAAQVQGRVWNGSLSADGMDNGATLTSNRGDIEVRNCSGPIVTHTRRGKQELNAIFGALSAEGLVSDLVLQQIRGDRLAVSIYRGTVSGRDIRSRDVSVRTTYGDIELQGQAVLGGRYDVNTYSGNVSIRFRNHIAVKVRAKAKAGVQLPHILRPRRQPDGTVLGRSAEGDQPMAVDAQSATGRVVLSFTGELGSTK